MNDQVNKTEPTAPLKYVRTHSIEACNKRYREEGYKVHSVIVNHDQIGDQNPRSNISYLMSLQEPSKYDDVAIFKKLPITFDETLVPDGWKIIHHTSKEMILVKKRVEAEEPVPNIDPGVWEELINMSEEDKAVEG